MRLKLSVYASAVLILLAFCGCSDVNTAEKRLANELPKFASRYVKKEFARQIQLNDQCKAFRINENRLLLLGFDGIEVVQNQPSHKDLLEFAVARYYVGQELDIKCTEASWSNLTAVNHERFSYRSLITFKFTDIRRMWRHMPGNMLAWTVFKAQADPKQITADLLNMGVKDLPGEKFDFHTVYSRTADIMERTFTVTVFANYDSSLPGWVPEDPEFAADVEVNAESPDWLESSIDKFKPQTGTELYKEYLYWRNSKNIRKNYDEGLVFFQNKWMVESEAGDNIRLNELVSKFDPDQADISELTTFLRKARGFAGNIDLSSALKKAVTCAENIINNLRNGDDYRKLEKFYDLMINDPAYGKGFDQLLETAAQAISASKKRINRQLENSVGEIQKSLNAMQALNSPADFTPDQINIECVRQENVLKKICQSDAEKISKLIFQIRYLLLLQKRHIDEVNKLYRYSEYKEQIRFMEKTVLKKCSNCRKGLQKCIYCEKAPGICRDCEGRRPVSDEKCQTCQSSGVCVHCRGRRFVVCMMCQGRDFVILHSKADALCRQMFAELEKVLNNNIADLENKKLTQ